MLCRADVATRLRSISQESGHVTADRARASLSAMINWSIREGMVEHNPVLATNKYAGRVERDRVLSDSELGEIWAACLDDDYGNIVKLLMLLPARRQEIADLAWQELDLAKQVWTLPPTRSKNNRSHAMPLGDIAWSILHAVRSRGGRDLLFGRSRGGFSGWSKSKAALDARILTNRLMTNAMSQPLAWRLHDLRRTCATRLAELGVPPHVIEALLNHISGHKSGVAGVYNRATYEPDKKNALTRWETHLRQLFAAAPAKVSAPLVPELRPPSAGPATTRGPVQPESALGRHVMDSDAPEAKTVPQTHPMS